MKKLKKLKKIILLFIIVNIGIISFYLYFKNREIAVGTMAGELKRVVLSEENCDIDIDENKVFLQKFNGNADTAVINKDIAIGEPFEINPKAFLECTNLDNILIEKELVNEKTKIENFKVNEDSKDDEYVEYKNTQEYSEAYQRFLETSKNEKKESGIIPDKYDVSMDVLCTQSMEDAYKISQINDTEIPKKFDLRDKINIKVENQGNAGICYSFASLTAVETNLALRHNDYVDLSEAHQAALTYGYWGRFISQSDLYYVDNIGPVYESEWPMENVLSNNKDEISKLMYRYFTGEALTNSESSKMKKALKETTAKRSVERTVAMPSIYKSNVYTSEELETARRTFKTHIMKYGSLSAAIYSNSIVCKDNVYVSNTKEIYDTDHLVSIIGWDDNFAKDNFPINCRPENDGAYLVLNSWGDDWGNDGCFWISYEDYWVENSLRGVIDVEDVQDSMNIESIVITDQDTNKEINSTAIKGSKIQVEIDANINKIIDNQNEFIVNIISPNGEDITNSIEYSGNNIVNNKAKLIFKLNTNKLQVGEYTINLKYADESKYVPIEIKASTFDFSIKEDETIKITGYYGDEKCIEIPQNFLGYRVTGIADKAFYNNNLESITIYDNIIDIGSNIIDKKVIIYGNTGTYIEQYASQNGYTFIKLDDEYIEGNGWKFNKNEKKLYISENLQEKTYQYLKSIVHIVEIKEPATQVFNSQFEGYNNLEEVILPNTVTYIGEKAFRECYNLKKINIPDNLTKLQWQTFYYCENLKTIEIPNGLKTIGSAAFSCCVSLESLEIPESVTSIENTAFCECRSLQRINIPKKVSRIDNYTFYNCMTLESIQLPDGITNIGTYAFYKCYNLKDINIPNSVTNIGTYAFNYCISLKNFNIPTSVYSVGTPIVYWATIKQTVEAGTTEVELPDIIKRALKKGDILYCGTGINITSGRLNDDQTKILINENSSRVIIYISSGPLKGMRMIIDVSGLITYDYYNWTNNDVIATLHVSDGEKIMNNSGEPKYKFTENGEFEFEYINQNGENKKVLAKANNIDKNPPRIEIKSTENNDEDIESVTIEVNDDESGLNSFLDFFYAWGDSKNTKPEKMELLSTENLQDGDHMASINVPIENLTGKKYLWIVPAVVEDIAGNEIDRDSSEIVKEFYLGPKLSNIEIVEPPSKLEYIEGQSFDDIGMKVNIIYANGFSKNITEYKIQNGENLSLEQNNVTISYEERNVNVTTTQDIEVVKNTVENIKILTPPSYTSYYEGDIFNSEGMVVEAMYKDGTKKVINDYIIEDGNSLNNGQTSVTIKYEGQEVKQMITVEAKMVVSINVKKLPDKIEYIQDKEDIDLTGGIIEITYNNNSKEEILMTSEQVVVNGFDNKKIGEQIITVTYQDITTQFAIEIKEEKIDEPENSDLDSARTNVKRVKIYNFTDNTKKNYATIDLEISGIKKAIGNDKIEYYYFVASSNNETNISEWTKIEQINEIEENLIFQMHIDNIQDETIQEINKLYIYIKEVSTKNNIVSEKETEPLALDIRNVEIEKIVDGEKVEPPKEEVPEDGKEDATKNDDKKEEGLKDVTKENISNSTVGLTPENKIDTTIAQTVIPKAGKDILILSIVILILLLGTVSYFKYKGIETK